MLQERKPRLTYHNLGYTRKQINARVVELVGKDQLHVSVFNASSGSILLAILDRTRASDDLIVSEPLVIDDVTIHCYGLVTNDPEMFDTAIIDNLEDVDQNTKEFRYNGFTMLKQKGKHKELDRYRSTTIDIKIQQFHMRVPDDWHEKMSFRIEDIIKTPPIKIDLSMLEFMDSINAVLVSEHSTEIKKIDNLVYVAHNIYIGKNSVITAHVCLCGSSIVEEGVWIAPNVSVINKAIIGKYSKVGLGSVVTKDVPPYAVVYGNPAKEHGFVR